MFKTIGLNIDNPHFLVAQGRITKIINLRPAELISMLEETAGSHIDFPPFLTVFRNIIIQRKEERVTKNNRQEGGEGPRDERSFEDRHRTPNGEASKGI